MQIFLLMICAEVKLISNYHYYLHICNDFAGLKYTSLSFIYINLPQISYLQWHPFSIASSPLDGSQELTVYIKPLGTWTQSLKESIQSSTNHHDITKLGVMDRGSAPCPFSMALSAEGPYGHETNFFLR